MKFTQSEVKKVHYVKINKGEDILKSIINYAKEKKLLSGFIYGIGAVEKASLGYFDVSTKTYLTNEFNFYAEMISCMGNVALNDETGEPIAHLHMVIGDSEGKTFGGHVLPGNIISVTGEFVIVETDVKLSRKKDKQFSLHLLDL
ncbi:MAG: PPC domain-containing DNA-binding protein [Candidatus Heimdallarchaeaceae archaeon]